MNFRFLTIFCDCVSQKSGTLIITQENTGIDNSGKWQHWCVIAHPKCNLDRFDAVFTLQIWFGCTFSSSVNSSVATILDTGSFCRPGA